MVEFQNPNGNSRFAKPLFFEKFHALPNTQLKSSAFFLHSLTSGFFWQSSLQTGQIPENHLLSLNFGRNTPAQARNMANKILAHKCAKCNRVDAWVGIFTILAQHLMDNVREWMRFWFQLVECLVWIHSHSSQLGIALKKSIPSSDCSVSFFLL